MIAMENLTQPRAAACPETTRLLSVTAHDLYMSAGFDSVAGWPLPGGWLPVAVAGLGIVQTTPAEWERYRTLCDGERLLREVNP